VPVARYRALRNSSSTSESRHGSAPLQCSGITVSLSSRSEKVPLVCGDVDEDCNTAVWHIARLGEELDPVREHAAVAQVEVAVTKEQSDASGELRSNCCSLAFAVGRASSRPVAAPGGRSKKYSTPDHRFSALRSGTDGRDRPRCLSSPRHCRTTPAVPAGWRHVCAVASGRAGPVVLPHQFQVTEADTWPIEARATGDAGRPRPSFASLATTGEKPEEALRRVPLTWYFLGSPYGIRTRAATLRGWCPRPLDERAK
jgi:hypothetical protein